MSGEALTVIKNINEFIIWPIESFLLALAVVIFLWGLVEFIWKADSDTGREKGRSHILWGIIGFFIMLSVISIIKIALDTFGIPTEPLNSVF